MIQIKNLIKHALLKSKTLDVFKNISHSYITILAYHSIEKISKTLESSIGTGINIEPSTFEKQICHVSKYCNTMSICDVYSYLNSNRKIPSNSVVITFDDGFKNNYQTAAQILKKYNLKATFYVTAAYININKSPFFVRLRYAFMNTPVSEWADPLSGYIWNVEDKGEAYEAFLTATRYASTWCFKNKENFTSLIEDQLRVSYDDKFGSCLMAWKQVRELHNDGHTIGGHTMSHPNLMRIPLAAARDEIHNCKLLIEEHTGVAPEHFAFRTRFLVLIGIKVSPRC
jgi:peptidoglycan/xylan/chitin deacetylase (PgdA/CDA1 family)